MTVLSVVGRRGQVLIVLAVASIVVSAALVFADVPAVLTFAATAVALGILASLVGEGTDQLSTRLSPAATGIVQSGLGNLPELFIAFFSLRAGLVVVVQSALIGSILANSLLVLGLAFVVGGLRHGTQRFEGPNVRSIAMLLLLAVAALVIPTLATAPGAPDAGHASDLSVIVSIVLLVVFVASIAHAIGHRPAGHSAHPTAEREGGSAPWPLWLALLILGAAGLGAAFVADWFVEALRPAMAALSMSEAFAGLVVVAIAGNAVENVVGVTAAARNEAELAVSLILNSSLQVALALTPVLVLLSILIGGPTLTLVVSPLLAGSVAVSALLTAIIVFDGESDWLEGLALIGLYVIIAGSVWWGPAIVA